MAPSLKTLREEAKRCQACPLWANATQTVFGAGDPRARVVLVGEQPGDEEDRKGLPFVGPAGREIDACHRWLEGELAAIRPDVVVALGATAAKALLGPDFRVSVNTALASPRGRAIEHRVEHR
jgi:DNA polymerase